MLYSSEIIWLVEDSATFCGFLGRTPNKQKENIEIYTKIQNNGQIWVETRGGIIQDAGVNRPGNYR